MIKFIHQYIDTPIIMTSQKLNVLVVESPQMYYEIVQELTYALSKNESKWKIVENSELYKNIEKIEFITDVFNINFNDKKIISALTKKIAKEMISYEFVLEKLYTDGYKIINDIIIDFDSEIILEDKFDALQFVKLYNPMLEVVYDTLLAKIVAYVNILVDIVDLKYLIILNIQDYISQEDMLMLFEYCRNRDVAILCLQSERKYSLEEDSCIIIDKDLCEVL